MYRYICSYAAELASAGFPAESIFVIGEDAVGYAMCEVSYKTKKNLSMERERKRERELYITFIGLTRGPCQICFCHRRVCEVGLFIDIDIDI